MRMKDTFFQLSDSAVAELEELYQHDKNSSREEIIEKAIDLLNAVELLGDVAVPALNSEYCYDCKKRGFNPVVIE